MWPLSMEEVSAVALLLEDLRKFWVIFSKLFTCSQNMITRKLLMKLGGPDLNQVLKDNSLRSKVPKLGARGDCGAGILSRC